MKKNVEIENFKDFLLKNLNNDVNSIGFAMTVYRAYHRQNKVNEKITAIYEMFKSDTDYISEVTEIFDNIYVMATTYNHKRKTSYRAVRYNNGEVSGTRTFATREEAILACIILQKNPLSDVMNKDIKTTTKVLTKALVIN